MAEKDLAAGSPPRTGAGAPAEYFASLARAQGFETVAALEPATLEFLPEVREMCAADRCRSYGKNWSCPPACGSLEDWKARCGRYQRGLLLQTVGEREDSWDFEAMEEAALRNRERVDALAEALLADGADFLFLAAGTCTRCETCTYPDAPCRFPEKLFPSMEACGLFVSKVCADNGVAYYYGDDKIAYTCCLLFQAQALPESAAR